MKKLISILLLSGIMLSLSGCVSQKDYKDLEKRVEYLEQQQNTAQSTTIETTNIIQTSSIDETTESTIISNEKDTYWSLEGMTAEEIYAECKEIFNTIPKQGGKTLDEYFDCLKYKPNNRDLTIWSFDDYDNDKNDYYKNHIWILQIHGLQEEMDGTIGYKNKDSDSGLWVSTSIKLRVSDYNIVKQIYDLRCSEFSNVRREENGTSWYAYANNPQSEFILISVTKDDNSGGYIIEMTDYCI